MQSTVESAKGYNKKTAENKIVNRSSRRRRIEKILATRPEASSYIVTRRRLRRPIDKNTTQKDFVHGCKNNKKKKI